MRKAKLIDELQQLIQTKKNLAAQKDEVETVYAQLASWSVICRVQFSTVVSQASTRGRLNVPHKIKFNLPHMSAYPGVGIS